ncbi:uncharacterized protein [Malus domestica]|uniref:uncharacterized protein n=1 Tax=Malus domestica TaxID=3750 RepID=UPI0007ED11A3|nr:uncharacterized protein LOC108169852 [Malus domestica]
MAQLSSIAQIQEMRFEGDIEVQKRNLPSIFERGFSLDAMTEEMEIEDWMTPIVQYLKDPSCPTIKKFIETKMLHRFRVPETIVTDCGPSFISREVDKFASKFKIKIIQSSPCYPQSNGQAEASNTILVNIIKNMVTNNPEEWHEKLGETLWAYRTSKRARTGTTPYALTFGHDVIFLMEINVSYVRIQNQFGLHSEEYIQAMCQRVENLDVARIEALDKIQDGKRVVARAYNKKSKIKNLQGGGISMESSATFGSSNQRLWEVESDLGWSFHYQPSTG